jgi:hypothetical protein
MIAPGPAHEEGTQMEEHEVGVVPAQASTTNSNPDQPRAALRAGMPIALNLDVVNCRLTRCDHSRARASAAA